MKRCKAIIFDMDGVIVDSEPRHERAIREVLRAAGLRGDADNDWCVIEDPKPGVTAGLAAGMQVIAITNTHPFPELGAATRVVRTYGEIEQLLLETSADGGLHPPAV